jgi:hypothetical protein
MIKAIERVSHENRAPGLAKSLYGLDPISPSSTVSVVVVEGRQDDGKQNISSTKRSLVVSHHKFALADRPGIA